MGEPQQVVLDEGVCDEELCVTLFEARPGDPAVPQGKAFATISSQELGLPLPSQPACGWFRAAPYAHNCP